MQRRALGGCTATGLLKLLALAFMMIDHAGKMVFGNAVDLRLLGRIAFPIYVWCMVVGASYTRSFPRYLLRLGILFLVSQPIYMVALDHAWLEPNVFLTLMVGLCALWGLREKRWGSQVWAPVLALVVAEVLKCDYGWRGVLLMILLWAVRSSGAGIAAVMAAFCLFWGSSSTTLNQIFGMSLAWARQAPWSSLLSPWLKLQGMAILSLPFLLLPLKRDFRLPAWLGYGIYPAHLLVLIAMEGTMLPGGWAAVAARWSNLIAGPLLSLFGLS